MHFTQYVAALVAAGSFSLASEESQQFTINQVDSGYTKVRNGAIEMKRSWKKFGGEVPEAVEAAAARASGTVMSTPEIHDKEYLTPVKIGTPGTMLMMDFDTGSADLWAFSNMQPKSQSTGHSVYKPGSSSSSSAISGAKFNIQYGDGSHSKGVVYQDRVIVGGVTAAQQAVEAATDVSGEFIKDKKNDGIFGLAFSSINTVKPNPQTDFFGTVRSSLASPLFAAYLKKGAPGAFDFGFINPAHHSGKVHYTNVNPANGFWQIVVDGYAVGKGKGQMKEIKRSIVDTGTSLLFLPNGVLDAYYSKVQGAIDSAEAGGAIFPCKSKLPDLHLIIGGSKRTIPGEYINYAPFEQGYCFGGLQTSQGMGVNILGDVFLKSQYAVFDAGNTRMGFADQA